MAAIAGLSRLELVFDILRITRRSDVAFRKWVILRAAPANEWDDWRDDELAPTQPMRVCRAR